MSDATLQDSGLQPDSAPDYPAWIAAALSGDDRALEALLRAIEPPLFRLALRMLGNFGDAEDATQEILVKLTTSLSSFAGRSAFTTWAYSVAANHLRDVLERRSRTPQQSLDDMQARLDAGLAVTADWQPVDLAADPALALEAREMGLRCTQGMLMCVDADQRLALVLTEVFDLDTETGAEVAGCSADAFRQRLSRGRRRMEEFLAGRCGLVDPQGSCNCARQATAKKRSGAAIPIQFAGAQREEQTLGLQEARDELVLIQRFARVLHQAPAWQASENLHERLRAVIASSRLLSGAGHAGVLRRGGSA